MDEKGHGDEGKETEGAKNQDAEGEQHKSRARTISEGSDGQAGQDKKQRVNLSSLAQHNDFFFPSVPASPPKFISLDQIMEAASGFSNMALAHEIAVNREFVLEKTEPVTSIEKQVKKVVHKAFWDALESQLMETPPNYVNVISLLGEIKEGLMSITLPQQSRIRNQINEALDLELVKQQIENDALDVNYYAKFILSTMSRLCAPVRDENVVELMSLEDIIPLYKGILETLELMKLDMANFAISQIRPHIQQHSVEYERKKFKEFLDALAALTPPVDGLELTRKWLRDVYEKFSAAYNTSSLSSTEESFSNSEVIIKAYIGILEWNNESLFPEVLQMDQVRFLPIRDQLSTVILTASLLLVTYSIVGVAIQGIESLKSKLKDDVSILLKDAPNYNAEQVQDIIESTGFLIVKEVNGCLEEHGYPVLEKSKETVLLAQLKSVSSEDHSVRKLIKTRVFEFIENVLTSVNIAKVKFPAGLSAFHKELSGLSGQFLRLVNHNRAVFGDLFNDILSSVKEQRPHEEQSTASH